MNTPLEEPSIPEKLKWPLAALWISLGLHGALIALVQIAPPPAGVGGGTIEARLVSVAPPLAVSPLTPSIETNETTAVEAPESDKPADPVETPNTPPLTAQTPPPSPPPSAIPRLEIPIAVDLHYYAARELDQTPRGQMPDLAFPETVSGRIRFQVKIEESGQVSEVKVLESEPPNMFDSAALDRAKEALRTIRFTPGIKDGRPVRSENKYELMIKPGVSLESLRN